MAESVLPRQITPSEDQAKIQTWIRRLVWKIAIATFLLMAVGSATRVMNAGLACPDWPLCYGQLIPTRQMNLQVFLEWFHRLDAALIGISAIVLMGLSWWYQRSLPRWLPGASTFALGLIVFQGILGGLTVTELLRFDIVTAHLATALLFFSTLIVIATSLTPYSRRQEAVVRPFDKCYSEPVELLRATQAHQPGRRQKGKPSLLPWIGLAAAILVYLQSLLGGLVASRWALHQCLSTSQLCLVMNSHILGVIPATLSTVILVAIAWHTSGLETILSKLANLAGGLVLLQIILGVATFRLHLQVETLTVAHHCIGAALLGTLVAFTVFAIRDRSGHIESV